MVYYQQQWGKQATARRPTAAGSKKTARETNQQMPVKASFEDRKDVSKS